jgi:hypothetical protein
MRRPRFTIASLLGVVVFVAVAIASLREATDLWDCGVFTATAGLLLASVLWAVHRTGLRRAFWLGFALFGWVYLVASLVPAVEPRLLTTKALAYLDSKVPGRNAVFLFNVSATGGTVTTSNAVQSYAFSTSGGTLAANQPGAVRFWSAGTGPLLAVPNGTTENFVRIGHSLIALIMAFFGGHLSRRLYARRGQDAGPSPTGVTATSLTPGEA